MWWLQTHHAFSLSDVYVAQIWLPHNSAFWALCGELYVVGKLFCQKSEEKIKLWTFWLATKFSQNSHWILHRFTSKCIENCYKFSKNSRHFFVSLNRLDQTGGDYRWREKKTLQNQQTRFKRISLNERVVVRRLDE